MGHQGLPTGRYAEVEPPASQRALPSAGGKTLPGRSLDPPLRPGRGAPLRERSTSHARIHETRDEPGRFQPLNLLDKEGLHAKLAITCRDCLLVAAEDVNHMVPVDQDELAFVLRLELRKLAQIDLQLPFERHAAPRSRLSPTHSRVDGYISRRDPTGLRYPRSIIAARRASPCGREMISRCTSRTRAPMVPEIRRLSALARRRAARSSVNTRPPRASATARHAASPAWRYRSRSAARRSSVSLSSMSASQDQSPRGTRPSRSPADNSSRTALGVLSLGKACCRRSCLPTCAKLLRTVVSARIRVTFRRSVDLQSCGDFSPCFFERGWSEAQGDSKPEEAVLQLEPRETQKVGRLPQTDLISQIGMQGFDIGFARMPSLPNLDRTLSERLQEAETHRIQKYGLLLQALAQCAIEV